MIDSQMRRDDPRVVLLLSLYIHGVFYIRGVFDFEHTRRWAAKLGLAELAQRRLLSACVAAHFATPDDLAAA